MVVYVRRMIVMVSLLGFVLVIDGVTVLLMDQ